MRGRLEALEESLQIIKGITICEKQECFDKVNEYVEVGVTRFIFMTFAPYNADEPQAFAEDVFPAFRG